MWHWEVGICRSGRKFLTLGEYIKVGSINRSYLKGISIKE